MTCQDFKVAVEEYLASSLDQRTLADFEQHRNDCPACRHYLQDIVKLAALLRIKDPVRAPSFLWDNIESRLGQDTPATPPIIKFMRSLSALAAVALIVFVALGLSGDGHRSKMDRIQTSDMSWGSAEDGDEIAEPVTDLLMSPRGK
jgi:predicted anti-sigma-YlaC factor YlaD